jgi:hypothetical protein
MAFGAPAIAWAQTRAEPELSLYGIVLKDAEVEAFLAAAREVGGVPVDAAPGAPPTLDMRAAGIPALQRLSLLAQDGKLARVQFVVKGYGQDNLSLRQLLLGKYGVPMTVSPRPMTFGGFGNRASPRGGFQWRFAGGMTLVYEHPRVGDVTLSYVDEARMQALEGSSGTLPPRRPAEAVRDRI